MFWNKPLGLPLGHLEELFGEPWEWVPGHWNVDFIQAKNLVTLFLSAADVLLGWGPLAVLILTTFVKSLFTRSSTEKTQTSSIGQNIKTTTYQVRGSPLNAKCWSERHCTLSTFPRAACCGLSALPRNRSWCRPPIFAKLFSSNIFPLLSLWLVWMVRFVKVCTCSASTRSILSTKSAEDSKWAEQKPTGFPSSRHMIILNILFETPIYSKEDENILWLYSQKKIIPKASADVTL